MAEIDQNLQKRNHIIPIMIIIMILIQIMIMKHPKLIKFIQHYYQLHQKLLLEILIQKQLRVL